MTEKCLDKISGALLGTFTGDALGMPVEGWPFEAIARQYGEVREMLPARLGAGTYTDDTEMMIGIAESLVRCRGFNGNDLAQTFCENFNPQRGYGPGTRHVLQLIKEGVPWEEAAERVFPGGSYGNGAPMRVAPVACLYAEHPEELRRAAGNTARLTHTHPLATEGTALQAYAIALALTSDPAQPFDALGFLNKLKDFLAPDANDYRAKVIAMEKLLQSKPSRREIISQLGNDVTASNSVCTAIYAFLSHHRSFEEAVVYAVNLGGDTDTLGALTGAISGAYHGKQGIPERWLDTLEDGPKGRRYVEELAVKLWKISRSENA